jgi:excisionase family DNA binding protein
MNTSKTDQLALSIQEVEFATSIRKDLIYAAVNSGELPSLKIGRRRLIRRESLQKWLIDREAQTTKEMGFAA